MTGNLGLWDRRVRAAIAAVLVVAGTLSGQWPVLALAVLMLGSAVVGFCPLYRLYGVSTRDGLQRDCPGGSCSGGGPPDR